jgi:DNA-binding XRE family transcriptional regulator
MDGTMAEKKSLKHVRASVGLSQAQLAILADIGRATVVEAEGGRAVRLTTAYAIVGALNLKLKQRGQSEITISDLDWNLEE